jgi:glycine hydroxymethyltransferase
MTLFNYQLLKEADPEIFETIRGELGRQRGKLELIASENFTSLAVLAAEASVLTNKYAEGYPGKRYYGGCRYVDDAEQLARDRACRLFHSEYANVQPHSGSQANMAAYFALINPGDTILGMNLAHGGHLSHGSPVSFSGRLFNIVSYGVNRDTETLDMGNIRALAEKHRPQLILAGASAYPRIIDFRAFSEIARDTGAFFMVDMAHIAGLVATGLHPSPIPEADVVTTTTHKTLRGPRGGMILSRREWGKPLDGSLFPGIQGGPLMHIIAAKAVALKEALAPGFVDYQRQVVENARTLAGGLHDAGFRLVSGGTDTHLILIDVGVKGLTGSQAEEALDRAGITTNKNAIPYDSRPPKTTSGIRLGAAALTTRGFKEPEMKQVAGYIADALTHQNDEKYLSSIREDVDRLCRRFPLYPEVEI